MRVYIEQRTKETWSNYIERAHKEVALHSAIRSIQPWHVPTAYYQQEESAYYTI